ncbi:MAG: DUF2779 domain-containing protein [Candidatus Izemoplasmatales bacterium]|nr:DUF2779 domain-containing protein [Candidatus Izemoplasmatales bacterium]
MLVRSVDLLNHLRCRRYSALARGERELKNNPTMRLECSTFAEAGQEANGANPYASKLFDYDHLRRLFAQTRLGWDNTPKECPVRFERNFEDLTLVGETDFTIPFENETFLIRTSLSSASAFLRMNYTFNKRKLSLFDTDGFGIYRPRRQHVVEGDKTNYYEKLQHVLSRHDDTGRIVYDLAFTEFVLSQSQKEGERRYLLAMLNPTYRLKMAFDKPQYDEDLFLIFDMTDLVDSLQDKIKIDLYRMKTLLDLSDESPCPLVKNECLKDQPFECRFTHVCFDHIPKKNSILAYFSSHLGFREGPHKNDPIHDPYELFEQGMVHMLDVPISWLHREKNLMQRYCVENDFVYINKKKIRDYMQKLSWPLCFLDFEAAPRPIPAFEGERPYEQSLFQYSIHIQLHENEETLLHKEFLGEPEEDARKRLYEQLMQDIPPTGSIVVYNQTFEESRLRALASWNPAWKDQVDQWISRMFDMLKMLRNDQDYFLSKGYSQDEADTYNFYHPKQSGSYSIKTILKVLTKQSYDRLDIKDGVMAYESYLALPSMPPKKRAAARKALLAYCMQDTMSMVSVLAEIRKLL